jgi:hypothetical protein
VARKSLGSKELCRFKSGRPHHVDWSNANAANLMANEGLPVTRGEQPALFALKDDLHPSAERMAAERYQEPTLFSVVAERGEL